jgi:hypothetical protein
MIPYVGSGEYCYANSLHMSLLGSGGTPDTVPSPGFLGVSDYHAVWQYLSHQRHTFFL